MSKSTKRLGRGLDSLVPNLQGVEDLPEPSSRSKKPIASVVLPGGDSGIRAMMIASSEITPNPYQPRKAIDDSDIRSLAASIEQSGILQPITVRATSRGYEIIAGERRYRAAKVAGLNSVPVIVKEATDEQMLEWALVENIHREDLNAIDRALAYKQLSDSCNLKPQEVGKRVGEDRSTVANYLRLLELPKTIQRLVAEGALSMGHARCLLGVETEAERWRLAEAAARNELSVRALEEIIRRKRKRPEEATSPVSKQSAHTLELQRRFEEALKTKVTIHEAKRKGTGRIVIEYFSLDDFDRVAETLGVHLE